MPGGERVVGWVATHPTGLVGGWLEMVWPDFNELGDLPVGIHRAKLADVVAHFGRGSAQRVAVTGRLERIYELARISGCLQRFIVFGSYVTAEPNPHDVVVGWVVTHPTGLSQMRLSGDLELSALGQREQIRPHSPR
ncbi:MAG: hypothetical protein HY268_10735 [Deltaproteobacteria bacterium]|nr:hypothetical protein [Deltaproteobacteria bacterium]